MDDQESNEKSQNTPYAKDSFEELIKNPYGEDPPGNDNNAVPHKFDMEEAYREYYGHDPYVDNEEEENVNDLTALAELVPDMINFEEKKIGWRMALPYDQTWIDQNPEKTKEEACLAQEVLAKRQDAVDENIPHKMDNRAKLFDEQEVLGEEMGLEIVANHDLLSSEALIQTAQTSSNRRHLDKNISTLAVGGRGSQILHEVVADSTASDEEGAKPAPPAPDQIPVNEEKTNLEQQQFAQSENESKSTPSSSSAEEAVAPPSIAARLPLFLPTFKPAIGCTNASDFIVRCFVARLRSGITVVKHGRSRWCKSRLRVLHVHQDGRSLSWKPALGEPTSRNRPPKFDMSTCMEVRHAWSPDPLSPGLTGTSILRSKCEPENAHKSFSLVFPKRTVDITAITADQCKVLMEGMSALCFRLQVASLAGANKGKKDEDKTSTTASATKAPSDYGANYADVANNANSYERE